MARPGFRCASGRHVYVGHALQQRCSVSSRSKSVYAGPHGLTEHQTTQHRAASLTNLSFSASASWL